MLPLLLFLIPLTGAGLMWFPGLRRPRILQNLLTAVSGLHLLLSALAFLKPQYAKSFFPDWIAVDGSGVLFLCLTSGLFFAVLLHTRLWLPAEKCSEETKERPEGLLAPHVFFSCLAAFLGTMTLVTLAQDFGLLWVAVEATTLVSAPLILFHRSARSLEAMWKYLLICSFGIGFALFGTMLLAVSARNCGGNLNILTLSADPNALHPGFFKAAFIFLLAGYGTKMGLAPFHTWLPDAHSEAPGVVSSLLSGLLLNCSFLAILRVYDVIPDDLHDFCFSLFTALGLLSLFTAACFTIRQTDFKRMLAYSSVEHMGLLILFVSIDSNGLGFFHLSGHSLIKAALFLTAGNLLLGCGTRSIPLLGGLNKSLPRNSALWCFGILMICGVPPSPLFATEFSLLLTLPFPVAAAAALLLFMIFCGMTKSCLGMIWGPDGEKVPASGTAQAAERLWLFPLLLLTGAAMLGVFFFWNFCRRGGF